METKDSNRKDLKAPIVSLTLGKKDMVCRKIHFEMCRLIITNRLSIVKDVQSVAEFNTNEGESASTHQYYLKIQYIRKEISKLLFLVICRLTTNRVFLTFLQILMNLLGLCTALSIIHLVCFFIRGCKFIVIAIFAKIASPQWAGHGLIWPYSPSSTTGFLLQYLIVF